MRCGSPSCEISLRLDRMIRIGSERGRGAKTAAASHYGRNYGCSGRDSTFCTVTEPDVAGPRSPPAEVCIDGSEAKGSCARRELVGQSQVPEIRSSKRGFGIGIGAVGCARRRRYRIAVPARGASPGTWRRHLIGRTRADDTSKESRPLRQATCAHSREGLARDCLEPREHQTIPIDSFSGHEAWMDWAEIPPVTRGMPGPQVYALPLVLNSVAAWTHWSIERPPRV